jgi:O-antigen/teichoic acid export membrane protein
MGAEQQLVYGVPEAAVKPPAVAADASAPLQLTSERLRVWGARAVFSLLDQGLFSGAGFLVNLLLARWLAPDSYGAFAVAFAGFVFISGFHNVLLLEPLTVMGPGRHSENLPAYFRAQLLIHFLLVGGLALAGLLGSAALWRLTPGSPLVGAIFGGALVLPLLLLLWLVRRMCYVLQRPCLAVAGTASYLALIVSGLAALRHFGWATPFLSFLLMGGASLAASGVLLGRIDFFGGPQLTNGISWRAALRENWAYGRWLVGSAVLYSIASQVQMFLVAGVLGLGAAGVLRAMQLPSLLVIQVSTAIGLIVLPCCRRSLGILRAVRFGNCAIRLYSPACRWRQWPSCSLD